MENKTIEFSIQAENGETKIIIKEVYGFPNSTSHFGGYDTTSKIEIRSSDNYGSEYFLSAHFHISTGDIFLFYDQLLKCYEKLSGTAYLSNYEDNLNLQLIFDVNGTCKVKGIYMDNSILNNRLMFNLNLDQSYLRSTLIDLKLIHEKYGDQYGKKRYKADNTGLAIAGLSC